MRRAAAWLWALAFVASPALAQNQIGVAAAVNPEATGTPPGAAPRVIQVGLDMLQDERVATGPQGRTQMLFLDGSALTLGPNSEVTLDEFVYDPGAGQGRLALSATRGLFRFVGGRISKTTPVQFRTPTATIGMRGGIAVIEVGAATRAQFLFGDRMTIEAGGVLREVGRPGFEVTARPGAAPSEPAPVSEQALAESLGGLEGVQGSTGGAAEQPTDENVASTQIAQLGSSAPNVVTVQEAGSRAPQPVARAIEQARTESSQIAAVEAVSGLLTTNFTYGGRVYRDRPFVDFDFATLLATRDAARNFAFSGGRIANGRFIVEAGGATFSLPAQIGRFTFQPGDVSSPFGSFSGTGFVSADGAFAYYLLKDANGRPAAVFGGVPFTPTGPSGRVGAFELRPGFPGDHAIPFIPAEFGGTFGNAAISPLYSVNRDPSDPPLPAAGRITSAFGAVAIEGQGANQRSAMTVYTGATFMDPSIGKFVLTGLARGSSRLSSTGLIVRHGVGGTSSPDADGDSFFGIDSADYLVLDSDFYPPGSNAPRQSAAGFAQPFEDLAASNEFFQTQVAIRKAVPAGVGEVRTSRTLNGYTAGVAEQRIGFLAGAPQFDRVLFKNANNSPLDLEIVTRADLNRARATFVLNRPGDPDVVVAEFGDVVGGGARSAFIDDRTFAMRESLSRPWMDGGSPAGAATGGLLTSGFFRGADVVPSGVQLCACEHLVWGFWTADERPTAGPERTRTHLAPFVAGELPSPASIPSSGTATYDGHVVANVDNAGAQYVAVGGFRQTWSFASRSGAVTISNLDGASYSGAVSSASGRDFAGAIGGAGRTGALRGSFFSGGGDAAAHVAANFILSGGGSSPYRVGGVAMGSR